MFFKLRCDLTNTSVNSLMTVVRDSTRYAYVIEGSTTDNPHVHFYLSTTTQPPALRARLRLLGLKGNGGYSLKKLDEEYPIEYLAYMHKEGSVTYHNVPQEVIEQAKAYQLKVATEILEKKKSKRTQFQMLCDSLEEEHPGDDIRHRSFIDLILEFNIRDQPKQLARHIVRWYLENDKVLNRTHIKNLIDTILCKYGSHMNQQYYIDQLLKFE